MPQQCPALFWVSGSGLSRRMDAETEVLSEQDRGVPAGQAALGQGQTDSCPAGGLEFPLLLQPAINMPSEASPRPWPLGGKAGHRPGNGSLPSLGGSPSPQLQAEPSSGAAFGQLWVISSPQLVSRLAPALEREAVTRACLPPSPESPPVTHTPATCSP